MSDRQHQGLELPYGKMAAWGVAASAVLTLSAVLFAPLSPVRLAREAVDAVQAGEARAAAAAVRSGAETGRASVELGRWIRAEIREELGSDVRARLRLEMRRELHAALVEGLEPGLRGALAPVVLGLRVDGVRAGAPLPAITIGL